MSKFIPSVGVEEEYQLVDPETGRLLPNCKEVMRQVGNDVTADIQHELHLTQIEMASTVCNTLDEVQTRVKQVRGQLIEAAKKTGAALVAAGTNPLPLPEVESFTPSRRYRVMSQRFQQIARDMLIFGCHVHVSIEDPSDGLQIMNQARRWLPLLQALSANSPFWDGEDTGYASYRRELWAQWPMAGPPPHFEDVDDYKSCVADLIQSGAIEDESYIYWDIRLPTKVPTIEFRSADVMLSVEETVGYTGLVRAIVMQATRDLREGKLNRPIRDNVLSYATWHAARYGVTKELVDPLYCKNYTAKDLIAMLLDHVRPSLDLSGDGEHIKGYLNQILQSGTGADRQRAVVGCNPELDDCDLSKVVQYAMMETASRGRNAGHLIEAE
ncbi:glutamate--cysteine ligase [Rubripirellula amarantea]|uniref:Putative glutamate--cysteine ligase 2 n=1 Tax=Rubripirellula amarantea TaxID=2527999 RepID=A0A5C5WUA6_9BACT|nr:glutamate--cysteine ligase [Rubripirellula amarantea]MDA8744331.1 glutamate--cysteine ligase [Rubripirellula amarantea]TWT53809.1 Carboxylate-amine ligase YbdK [Rubripirellula amarantea]